MTAQVCRAAILVALGTFLCWPLQARDLTFEDRVKAQEAIERVYYAHQIQTTKPFEEAVPRGLLEHKVRRYLEQTVALESYWHTGVTAEMLEREAERMTQQTRMPERLRELFDALGNDGFLVQECLVRPLLVDRLTRNFFAWDERIHGEARREAERLRRAVLDGGVDFAAAHSEKATVELVLEPTADRRETSDAILARAESGERRLELAPDAFAKWRENAQRWTRGVSPLTEEREAIFFHVALSQDEQRIQSTSFSVRKTTWDEWWSEERSNFDGARGSTVAPSYASLPSLQSLRDSFSPDRWQPAAGRHASRDGESTPNQSNTWDNGSLGGLPPVGGSTAVWTGSVMIVWGGSGGGAYYLDEGGRYDPATDTWTSTSTVNAPWQRNSHTAVWTGSVMIIWGGAVESPGPYGHQWGGRYDPITDTWKPMSVVGVSLSMYLKGQTAVWTGREMVVWGASNHHAYDPMTDSWRTISIAGLGGQPKPAINGQLKTGQ